MNLACVRGLSRKGANEEVQVLLEGKSAVIYGAGGSIGGAVSRAFAREGARVLLAGRTEAKLDAVAEQIRSAGGVAETTQLDALDEAAVDEHADAVVAKAGSLDISFNLISHDYVQGTPMAEMELDDYLQPVTSAVRTTFLTWRAAARHMARQGSGVILAFGGEGHPVRGYYLGALQVALHAIESMRRQLASELGAHGVRVVTLRTGECPSPSPRACSRGLPSRQESNRRPCSGAPRRWRTRVRWPRSWPPTALAP
jgi:NAD(P)-dependent dehydrogenase (short-subunit alcohol dehydrogenase family)